jgi:hypothetical protein
MHMKAKVMARMPKEIRAVVSGAVPGMSSTTEIVTRTATAAIAKRRVRRTAIRRASRDVEAVVIRSFGWS